MLNKYDNFYFWKQLFDKFNGDVSNLFRNNPITTESVFFHGVLVNYYNNEEKDIWSHFPDIYSMVGFIKHIFLPIAFYMVLSDSEDLTNSISALREQIETYEKGKEKQIIHMLFDKIDDIIKLDKENIFKELMIFSDSFRQIAGRRNDQFAYFDVFKSPSQVGEYIINCYKENEYVDINYLEEQLGVSAKEWKEICDGVYNNEFLKRRFTDILNNRITDML